MLYWALGELDVAGVAREDLADCLLMRQVAHLEDALQASRAISVSYTHLTLPTICSV